MAGSHMDTGRQEAITLSPVAPVTARALVERLSLVEAVAMDLDGTLLTTQKLVSDATASAVARAHEAGLAILPSTGRVRDVVPPDVMNLPGVSLVVGANGSCVMQADPQSPHGARIVRDRGIDPARGARLAEQILAEHDVYLDITCAGSIYAPRGMLARTGEFMMSSRQAEFIRLTRHEHDDFLSFIAERPTPLERINLYAHDQPQWHEVFSWLSDRATEQGIELANSLDTNIEINVRGVSKWDGIVWACERMGANPRRVLALGDGSNDVSMIESAYVGIAMGNAPSDVRSHADAVAPTNDEDGVARVLELLCDIRGRGHGESGRAGSAL